MTTKMNKDRGSIPLASIILALLLVSCSPTITRHEVVQRQASFSSSGQDSGIQGETEDKHGFIVNADWVSSYHALLKKYGQTLTPPRAEDDMSGIVTDKGKFMVSDSAMERFMVMNQRRVNDTP